MKCSCETRNRMWNHWEVKSMQDQFPWWSPPWGTTAPLPGTLPPLRCTTTGSGSTWKGLGRPRGFGICRTAMPYNAPLLDLAAAGQCLLCPSLGRGPLLPARPPNSKPCFTLSPIGSPSNQHSSLSLLAALSHDVVMQKVNVFSI